MVSDGWMTILGNEVYVENGEVKRGVEGGELDRRPTYPYRWDARLRVWTICEPKVATLRAGIKSGKYAMK